MKILQGGLRTPKLFPVPKSAQWGDGFLKWEKAEFSIDNRGLPTGDFLYLEFDNSLAEQEYKIKISEEGIFVRAFGEVGAKLALQTLRQIGMQADERGFRFVEIEDSPDLRVRGFMLDISRCKVPKMEELFRLIDILALFKYNRFELYMEHTFAFEGHSLVWGNASPITSSQIAELQKACALAGIELVPNMNGLGHMERWLRYPEYQHLAESTAPFLDPIGTIRKYPTTLFPDEKALDFMDSLYEGFLPNFESKNFNIGGDESWELGMGRSRSLCKEKSDKYKLYIKHILGLRERAAKYGKNVCFWADVLMKCPEYSAQLPNDMTPVLWGYYLDHPYEEQCSYMQKLGRKFLVAPGTSTWNSFGSRWDCAKQNILISCDCAKRYGAEGMILTQWGDNGNHQPYCAMFPAVVAAAANAWGAEPTEEAICDALDNFVFWDTTGELSRSLCALGRTDPNQKLFSFHHKMFFATPEVAQQLSLETKCDLGILDSAADFALSLAYSAKPQCKDGAVCVAEITLGVRMIRWALAKAHGDFATDTLAQKSELKLITTEYENVWLERARIGGLSESAGKIRLIKPEIFA